MEYHSKIVTTNQPGLHDRLEETVRRHLSATYLKPFQDHNLQAFDVLKAFVGNFSEEKPVLDSGCGTGMSTTKLADGNPGVPIVGLDQSDARLSRQAEDQRIARASLSNQLLLRANCEDIWRLCVDARIQFSSHYILYPNPWPKSAHLQRRWHGHPVFPWLPRLAVRTILRSNWRLYLEEFALAWQVLTGKLHRVQEVSSQQALENPWTLFELKYAQSRQPLYELIVES